MESKRIIRPVGIYDSDVPIREHTLSWYLKKAYTNNNLSWFNENLTDDEILDTLDKVTCPISYVLKPEISQFAVPLYHNTKSSLPVVKSIASIPIFENYKQIELSRMFNVPYKEYMLFSQGIAPTLRSMLWGILIKNKKAWLDFGKQVIEQWPQQTALLTLSGSNDPTYQFIVKTIDESSNLPEAEMKVSNVLLKQTIMKKLMPPTEQDISTILMKYPYIVNGMSPLDFGVPPSTAKYVLSVFNKTVDGHYEIVLEGGLIKLKDVGRPTFRMYLPDWIRERVSFDGDVVRFKALIASIEGITEDEVSAMLVTPQRGLFGADTIVSALGEYYFNTPLNAVAKFLILSKSNSVLSKLDLMLCGQNCIVDVTQDPYRGLPKLPTVNTARSFALINKHYLKSFQQSIPYLERFTEYELAVLAQRHEGITKFNFFKALILVSDASEATKQFIGCKICEVPVTVNKSETTQSLVPYSLPKQQYNANYSLPVYMQQVRYLRDFNLYQQLEHYDHPKGYPGK